MSEATKRKLIYVASPLRGDYKLNMARAKQYCKMVVDQGFIPYAPHLLFTQFMDDSDPVQRAVGMGMGKEMLKRCDELWVFGDTISEGMAAEIKLAEAIGMPILYINGVITEETPKEIKAPKGIDIGPIYIELPEKIQKQITDRVISQILDYMKFKMTGEKYLEDCEGQNCKKWAYCKAHNAPVSTCHILKAKEVRYGQD